MIISFFEDDVLGNVEDEMVTLGLPFAECFINHCYKLADARVDYRYLATFAYYKGVPIFRASIWPSFVVYALETKRQEMKIAALAAGTSRVRQTFGPVSWDGSDEDQLRHDVVLVRAAAMYR